MRSMTNTMVMRESFLRVLKEAVASGNRNHLLFYSACLIHVFDNCGGHIFNNRQGKASNN